MQTAKGPQSGSILSYIGFAVVIVILFGKSLFGDHSLLPTDILHEFLLPHGSEQHPISVQNHYTLDQLPQTYPGAVVWQESAKTGELPVWNPYWFGGHPQLATSVWGVLTPTKLLLLFCSPERAHTLGFILQFFLAGVFMMAFVRELGLSRWGAFLGGCAYAFNSQFFLMYWLWLNVFAWVPLALFLYERAVRRSSAGYTLAAGCALAIPLVSGSIQMTFYVVFLFGFYALGTLLVRPAEDRKRLLAQATVLFIVAVLVAAAQFLPTLELLAREAGGRIRNSDQGAMFGLRHTLLGISALVVFIFPALAGAPEAFDLLKVFRGTMMHFSGYIGLVPFLLFVVGVRAPGEKRKRIWLWLVIAVMAIVFFTPLLRFVYHRFFTVAIVAMSVLAAYGLDAMLENSTGTQKRIAWNFRLLGILALLLVIGLLGVQWYVQGHFTQLAEAGRHYVLSQAEGSQFKNYPEYLSHRIDLFLQHFRITNPLFWLPLATLLGIWLLWQAYSRGRINRNVFAGACVVLSLCDLLTFGRNWVPQVDLKAYPPYPPVPLLAKAQADPDLFRVSRWIPHDPLTLMDNVFTAYGLTSAGGYESLHPENLTAFTTHTNATFNSLLDLQNVKYLLAHASSNLPPSRFEVVAEEHALRLYKNKTCLPRLQFISNWRTFSDRNQLKEHLHSRDFDPKETVLLETEPSTNSKGQPGNPGSALKDEVRLLHYSARSVAATVRAHKAGMLLLGDVWYPGWKARIDLEDTTLYRADYVLKAVYVPPGEHRVEFYFEPFTFRLGAAISLVTLTLCIAYGGVGWVLRKRTKSGVSPARPERVS